MSNSDELTARSAKKKRYPEIMRLLRAAHPDAECALHHKNAYELLVATILSAQCTDERVNKVTPDLFKAYPEPAALAAAPRAAVEEAIRSTGFYRNKAKSIQEAAVRIVNVYDGEVPSNMKDLLTLQGVARKTANVVLGTWYGIADGVVVDTHVKRLSNKLRFTKQSTPEKIEKDLMALAPRDEWVDLSHLLIFHGRRVCNARKPNCAGCTFNHLCPSSEV